MVDPQTNKPIVNNDPPPLLKSWNRLYLIVILSLAANIILFYLFTVFFN